MASGPPKLDNNRFHLLSESPPIKRKATKKNITNITSEIFPALPKIQNSDPKFVVVSAKNSDKPLSHFSCFGVYRSLQVICKDIISISELRDGNLLILVKDSITAAKLISCKSLPGICEISIKFHDNLNYTKGTIYAPFLNNVPETEIVNELKHQGVVNVFKFIKTIDGKTQNSGIILLTFDRFNLPSSLDIAWRKVSVKQYIPNPMRCKNCQLLGHTNNRCTRSPTCDTCNLPPHSPTACTRLYCANCHGEHKASSNECPKFQQSKEILKIKITKKCNMRDAIKEYKQQNPLVLQTDSYAATAHKHNTVFNNPTQQNGISTSATHSNIMSKSSTLSPSKNTTPNNNQSKPSPLSPSKNITTNNNNNINTNVNNVNIINKHPNSINNNPNPNPNKINYNNDSTCYTDNINNNETNNTYSNKNSNNNNNTYTDHNEPIFDNSFSPVTFTPLSNAKLVLSKSHNQVISSEDELSS